MVAVVVVRSFEYFVPGNQLIAVVGLHQIECLVDFAMMELVLDYFDFENLNRLVIVKKKNF